MALVLDGSANTIAGLAQGGLPANSVTAATCNFSPGKILQVLQAAKTDTATMSSTTTFSDISGMTINITPASASNKILVQFTVNISNKSNGALHVRLVRDSTAIGISDASGSRLRCTALIRRSGDNNTSGTGTPVFLDSPSTTSQITYKAQISLEASGHTAYINRTQNDLDSLTGSRCMSSITVMEVSA